MREIQIHEPKKQKVRLPTEVVRRLQFFANGAELVAWIGPERFARDGRVGFTSRFHVCNLATNTTRELFGSGWLFESYEGARTPDPVISPDRALVTYESIGEFGEDDNAVPNGDVYFEELVDPGTESGSLPHLRTGSQHRSGGLLFTPDGTELIAVRNVYEGVHLRGGHWAPDVVRFEIASLKKPPVRYEEKVNPFTRGTYRAPVYDVCWLPVMSLPHDKVGTIALSTDGRLLAVGGTGGVVHVADLKDKKVIASFPWEGRFLRDGKPVRVGFDPAAQWIVMLANGRLFARPLGAGEAWQTKATLGYIHDFAFHPNGRLLCAVFRDGEALYLDPLTGKVRQSFKWAKKPEPLYSVAFAPDGLTCAAGGENGKVILWDVDA
jgi:WD40 repeat protein